MVKERPRDFISNWSDDNLSQVSKPKNYWLNNRICFGVIRRYYGISLVSVEVLFNVNVLFKKRHMDGSVNYTSSPVKSSSDNDREKVIIFDCKV